MNFYLACWLIGEVTAIHLFSTEPNTTEPKLEKPASLSTRFQALLKKIRQKTLSTANGKQTELLAIRVQKTTSLSYLTIPCEKQIEAVQCRLDPYSMMRHPNKIELKITSEIYEYVKTFDADFIRCRDDGTCETITAVLSRVDSSDPKNHRIAIFKFLMMKDVMFFVDPKNTAHFTTFAVSILKLGRQESLEAEVRFYYNAKQDPVLYKIPPLKSALKRSMTAKRSRKVAGVLNELPIYSKRPHRRSIPPKTVEEVESNLSDYTLKLLSGNAASGIIRSSDICKREEYMANLSYAFKNIFSATALVDIGRCSGECTTTPIVPPHSVNAMIRNMDAWNQPHRSFEERLCCVPIKLSSIRVFHISSRRYQDIPNANVEQCGCL